MAAPRAVVLGGYGLIGAATLRALRRAGFQTLGVGRSLAAGQRADSASDWAVIDLARASEAALRDLLKDTDVVVNAAGALQDGARDDLTAIHDTAIGTLLSALAGTDTRLIQISATGVHPRASTAFFRTKAAGDARIAAAPGNWIILRPTLVLGAEAYGGTALLRAAAATPLLAPRIFPEAPVQTVWVEDLAQAVVAAARGQIANHTIADITEAESRSFAQTVTAIRGWLGFAPWRASLPVPASVTAILGRVADGLGWLGWRPPLRTTALRTLSDGVTGNPAPWIAAGGAPMRPLAETLARIPATAQERWFARLFLVFPLAIATLSVFWVVSGILGLVSRPAALAVLTDRGISLGFAQFAVIGGALADIALGLALLVRPMARAACLGMVALSLAYLAGGTIAAPDLWADPLGPLVKVLPAITLALVTAALLEPR